MLSRHAILLLSLAMSSSLPALAQSMPAAAAEPAGLSWFFGDSDLEQGNFQLLAGTDPAASAPYDCTGGLCRDSNGPIWVERLDRDIRPALAADGIGGGLNFAVSGAHMTRLGDLVDTGVAAQVERFAGAVARGELTVGAQDRFYIHAGTNDLQRILAGEALASVKGDIVSSAVGNVSTLAGLGARTIYIAEVQNVSVLPGVSAAGDDVVRLASNVVAEVNADLSLALSGLKASLPEGVNVITVRQNSLLAHIRSNAAALGFGETDIACFDGQTLCAASRAEQDRYVFFDPFHLSSAGHALLARWYQATEAAATGEAAQATARLSDIALSGDQRLMDAFREPNPDLAGEGWTAFLTPVRSEFRLKPHGSAPQADSVLDGVLAGVGRTAVNGAFVRVGLGWSRQETTFATGGDATGDALNVMAIGGLRVFDARVSGWLGYSAITFDDIARPTGVPLLSARGETDARIARVGLAVDELLELTSGPFSVGLGSAAEYVHLEMDAFDEAGADGLALAFDSQNHERLILTETVEARWRIKMSDDLTITPFFKGALREDMLDLSHETTVRLIDNTANPARIVSGLADTDGVTLGLGVDMAANDRFALRVQWNRAVSGDEADAETLSARASFRF